MIDGVEFLKIRKGNLLTAKAGDVEKISEGDFKFDDSSKDKYVTFEVVGYSDIEFELRTFNTDCRRTIIVSETKLKKYFSFAVESKEVYHPSHYSWLKALCGVEPLDICRHLDFNVGNAIKYLLRKDKVDGNKTKTEKRIEDLNKAKFYIEDEIKLLKNGKG